jgi:hypothetical protein
MSILTVDQYQTLTGDSTTAEATIQNALYRYTAIIESYCNRVFGATAQTEKYYNVQRDPLILNRSNVSEVTAITVGTETADVSDFAIHYDLGFIYHAGAWFDQDVEVAYTAGDDAPYDVKHVLAALVQSYLSGVSGGENEVRPILQETVYGVSSTKYGASMTEVEGAHAELGAFTTILDRHIEPILA